MEQKLSPEEYLEKEFGMHMQTTTLITYLDGVMKQPSLSYLMSEYAKYVVNISKSKDNDCME